ncbi:retrotransposon protein, putative, ty1-copia subclass [Tanacetum coccineum]
MHEANAPSSIALGKPSYATATGKPSGKKVNVHTLYTPGGNGINVVVLVDSICAISERFANTAYGFFLGKKVVYPVVANYVRNTWDVMLENGPWFIQNSPLILKKWHPNENLLKEDVSTVPDWVKLHGVPITTFSEDGLSAIATKLGRSSYARVMIEFRADVELKDNFDVAMPKITREGHYTCNVHVEYEWKPPRCSSCKVFKHIHEEYSKNTGAGEKKTVKKPSQTTQGVLVGPKMGFKPQREYRHVTKKPNASSSGNKKKGVEPTIKFASNTPIGEKIDKIERQIYEGKLRLISSSGKEGSYKGYGTNSLLKQWRDSYPDNDDYDPYDDNMYENHDLSEHLQSVCDDLYITVRGRRKK